MRLLRLAVLLFFLALAVRSDEGLDEGLEARKGGGGGGKGGGGGGGKGGSSSGGKGSSGMKGGGGSSNSKGSGSLGDRPPSYALLFPARSNINAGGRPIGTGDSSRSYTPPPAYTAQATYSPVNHGQTLPPYTLKGNSPKLYYGSTTRSQYPGAWGYGYYPIYPYPYWAYGGGSWHNSTYKGKEQQNGIYKYTSEFRNITVDNTTSAPFIGDIDLFDNKGKVSLVDFNNGTITIRPCGNDSTTKLGVSSSDCNDIRLDLRRGRVLDGNAQASVHDDITFFELKLGDKTKVLRTMTISSTKKKPKPGPLAGIIIGSIVGGVLLFASPFLYCWSKRKLQARKALKEAEGEEAKQDTAKNLKDPVKDPVKTP